MDPTMPDEQEARKFSADETPAVECEAPFFKPKHTSTQFPPNLALEVSNGVTNEPQEPIQDNDCLHASQDSATRPGPQLVNETEADQYDEPSLNVRPPLRQSLGISNCVVIIGGTVLTFIAIGYLIFLWADGDRHTGGVEALHLWRTVMLEGWATRSVTLTAIILRVVSAAQAGICTSIVAALLLERRGVPLSRVAQLSITRSVNGGPRELLQWIISSRGRSMTFTPEAFLLLIVALTAFAIQFSSTILLSDFDTTRLVKYPNNTLVNLALSPTAADNVGEFLTVGDLDSSTVLFGELDTPNDPTPNALGISDIGVKRRAFLPFQKEDRVNVQLFEGAAFNLNTRSSCIRPSLTAKLYMDSQKFPAIEGTISYNQTFGAAGLDVPKTCYTSNESQNTYCLPETFNCTIPSASKGETPLEWPAAVCHLPINPDDSTHAMPAWDMHSNPLDFTSGSWPSIVFVSNISRSFWSQLSKPLDLGTPDPYGEWNTYEVEPSNLLNISLCFSGVNTTVSALTMTGEIDQSEPELQWNTTTYSFEVDSLQTLMGAGPERKTTEQRGVLSIKGDIQDPASPSAFSVNSSSVAGVISASMQSFGNGVAADVWSNSGQWSSVGMCDHCTIFTGSVSLDIATLFQHIINTSGRAAVAMDTYLAMLGRSWYYSLFQKFDVPGHVTVAFATEVLLPMYWDGITAVIVLVTVNIVCTWIITVLYICRARFTLVGNFWHAISQLISDDTLSVIEKSNGKKDDEVSKILKSTDQLVKIDRDRDSGRVLVVRC
ncbi:hypothetical protein F5Y06DRAFT_305694 [Hypoxylon sp. FL0890]|nr:hypothetical protein F5Y06DRAFT_305694 [Hypoxylon sp. FL0890]